MENEGQDFGEPNSSHKQTQLKSVHSRYFIGLRKTDDEEEDAKQVKVRLSSVQKVPTDKNSDSNNIFADTNDSTKGEDVK